MVGLSGNEQLGELLASIFPFAGVDTFIMEGLQYTFSLILIRKSSLWEHNLRDFLESEAMFLEDVPDRCCVEHPKNGEHSQGAKFTGVVPACLPNNMGHGAICDIAYRASANQ